jgi:hypothetical protein
MRAGSRVTHLAVSTGSGGRSFHDQTTRPPVAEGSLNGMSFNGSVPEFNDRDVVALTELLSRCCDVLRRTADNSLGPLSNMADVADLIMLTSSHCSR